MEHRSKESARHIDVVLRALDVLDCFQDDTVVSLKEIIDRTGVTRSRAMRLLGTLVSRGYLIEDPEDRKYYLGIKLAILGNSFEKFNNIEVITRPVLKQVVLETGESATLYVIDGKERVALIREEGTHAIRYSVREGQRLPLHVGAAGKILLACGPPGLLSEISSAQSANPTKLLKEINAVRKKGYAISKGENVPDAHAIAAPIFDFKNKLIGALGIAGPAHRLDDKQIKSRLKVIQKYAKNLSKQFGKRNLSAGAGVNSRLAVGKLKKSKD
jgi:DNA-binding IclR family transcriptional regulator